MRTRLSVYLVINMDGTATTDGVEAAKRVVQDQEPYWGMIDGEVLCCAPLAQQRTSADRRHDQRARLTAHEPGPASPMRPLVYLRCVSSISQ